MVDLKDGAASQSHTVFLLACEGAGLIGEGLILVIPVSCQGFEAQRNVNQ